VAAQGQVAQAACPVGSYQPQSGANSCLATPPGTFAAGTGSSAATPCEPGSYQPEPGATSCLAAQPGRFVAEAGAIAETPCDVGSYQPNSGAASCLPADPGFFVAAQGQIAQVACDLGSYQPNAGAASCLAAPVGTFVDEREATAAEFCPSGTTSRSPGAVRCDPLPEDAAPNGGDGNNDGIPDRIQDNVTSFEPVASEAGYWTIEAPPDSVVTGVYTRTDLPDFPFDASLLPVLVGFAIEDLTPGEAISTTVYLEEDLQPVSYFKYGPTPDRPEPHWYEFLYDGRTGARIAGNTVTLYFIDGERGDSDLIANGVIVDPGVPAIDSSSGCLFKSNGLQCTVHLPLVRSP
jgi:hypothetical protein